MKRSKFGYDWQHVFGITGGMPADRVPESWKCEQIFEDREDGTVILRFKLSEDVVVKQEKQIDSVRIELRKAQRFPVVFYSAGFGGKNTPYPFSGTVTDSPESGAELIRNLLQFALSWECVF